MKTWQDETARKRLLFRYFTCTYDPLEISLECFGKVLFHSQLSERLTTLNSGPLITEFSARKFLAFFCLILGLLSRNCLVAILRQQQRQQLTQFCCLLSLKSQHQIHSNKKEEEKAVIYLHLGACNGFKSSRVNKKMILPSSIVVVATRRHSNQDLFQFLFYLLFKN